MTLVMIDTDCIDSCKSHYHTIPTITAPVDRRFEPWLVQTKDYNIGICCFSAKHATLISNSTDWLARNENKVF